MANETQPLEDSRSTQISEPVPAAVLAGVAGTVCFFAVALLYFVWRWYRRRTSKSQQLLHLTPAVGPAMVQGVRHTIDFVLPTIQVTEIGEDSETDFARSYSDTEQYAARYKRRSILERYAIDPQSFQKCLYQDTLAGGGQPPTAGKVGFRLQYSCARQTLLVRVLGAVDLPPAFKRGTANPFVKVTILPDKTPKFASRVQRNTLNPCFGDIFSFSVKRTQVSSKTVRIAVWDHDRFSRKVLVGQACYPLKDSCSSEGEAQDFDSQDVWLDLLPDPEASQSRGGSLLVSLSYHQDSCELTCAMPQARGLKVAPTERDAAVYVKCALYVGHRLIRARKTPPRPRASEVSFGSEASSFTVKLPENHNPLTSNVLLLCSAHCKQGPFLGKTLLGRCRLGPHCGSDAGIRHWKDLIDAPSGEAISRWHPLT